MRFNKFALVSSVFVLMACGGSSEQAADTSATATADASAGAATTPAATPGAMAPITGTTHEVKMVGDAATGYKFVPENLTIKAGDGVKWTMVSGGPHNVAFQNVPAAAKSQLMANMPDQSSGELSSKMFMQPNEGMTMSFANVAAGKYDYICTPHLAMGMKGSITVQ
jgi:plastocyanin